MSKFIKVFSKLLIISIVVCMLFVFVSCNKNNNESEKEINYLSNQKATQEAKDLYNFLRATYGHKIISGQQESTWISEDYEFDYIYEHTGKYPAIRGLDFINDDFDGVIARAKKWHQKGGIVTICWHCSSSFDKGYEESQNSALTKEQWEAMLTEGTPEYNAMIQGMDKAGAALAKLQEANIPVLWRPFHEFDGWWFWWGQGIEDVEDHFKAIWRIMYNHYTNDLHLNNLIWVLGYSEYCDTRGVDAYYPGDEYCDIVGADSYFTTTYGAEQRLYDAVNEVNNNKKPMVMHENGYLPTAEEFEEVPWVWFMTWHTNYLVDENTTDALNALYNSDYVLTLDDIKNR